MPTIKQLGRSLTPKPTQPQQLYNFGMVIDGKPPAYDPDEIKRMN